MDQALHAGAARGMKHPLAALDVDVEHFGFAHPAAQHNKSHMNQRIMVVHRLLEPGVADVELQRVELGMLELRRLEVDAGHLRDVGACAQRGQQRLGQLRA